MIGKPSALGETRRAAAASDAPLGAPDEARLIARIVQRDRRAFEALYRLYHPRLTRFLGHLLRRPALAEEALNDTLMFVWDQANRFNGQSKVSTWIFAIAYRKGLNARRRQDEPREDPRAEARPSEEPGPELQLDRAQTHDILLGALAELSADHRAVVDLTYFHEMGYREIAEIMECPVDTVKTRMFHARRHLRRALAGRLADWI